MGGVGWMTPNFDPTYSLYRLSLGPVLDFVVLCCLEVNVKFPVENEASMVIQSYLYLSPLIFSKLQS